MTIRRALPALLVVLLALGLAACGERQEATGGGRAQRLDLVLDFVPNADHAGIYYAIGRGQFKRAGLSVRPRTPSDPSAPLKLLATGHADLAISYEPELLLARAKGAKLVSIGALVQRPLTSIISIGSKAVRAPGQLEDKKVGTAGIAYQDAYLTTIVDRAGIDPERVHAIDIGFSFIRALETKKVDATLGAFWNVEGVDLARHGKHPRILRVDQLGVPTYDELVIVAREQDVRRRGPLLRRFMRALALSHQALRDDVAGAVDELVRANPELDRGLQRAQVQATLPVFLPRDRRRPFGYQDPVAWRRYTQWMLDNDLLATSLRADRAFTNEFLPGEGI
ncbi:MAG: putative hydroxymethylpyrimidine transport system substrate-binding protein [Solirubrobacteraceae bacterium]|nr:putative hydroxymethylpyrimidine transport system substrate-binding protein [Solirubrobacteraceae bacterium]